MTDLDEVLNIYQAAVDSLRIVSGFAVKTTGSQLFHNTIFRGMSPDEAQGLISQTENEIRELAVVDLMAAFERILSLHQKSPFHSQTSQSGSSTWFQAMSLFKDSIPENVFKEAERVGKYRDWVAHGKRWDQPAIPDPVTAHDRLKEFLKQANLW